MKSCTLWVIGAVATALATHSWADLKSPTYQQAREAYSKMQWAKADHLLRRYQVEDRAFLAKNPGIAGPINKAVAFCSSLLQSDSIASVSDALDADQPPPPPPPTNPPPLP
jgi:hypothetical protein